MMRFEILTYAIAKLEQTPAVKLEEMAENTKIGIVHLTVARR